jgi:hypothetical protein
MNQILILLFFYFTILFSILGYGKLVTLFSSNDQDIDFQGFNGIALLIIISYLTNFFFPHDFLHNSIVILFGLSIFLFDIGKNYKKKIKEYKLIFLVFLIIFIGLLMYKNHDDFYYYHFPYTLILTNFEKIFGLGNLNHGFRTPSSIFYLNSLFYLPIIKYFLMNSGAIYIFGFANFFLIRIIKKFLKNKDFNFIFYLSLLSFIYISTAFYRIAEHGTDKSALILIFIMAIYYLQSINLPNDYKNIGIINSYFSKLIILFFLIISLKTFYLIYFFILLIWIFEMRMFLFQKKFLNMTYKNSSIYLFIFGIFFSIFTIFSNTGCLIYPASFTCLSQFSWSIPVDTVNQMMLWYELWAKGGANPNFVVDNPEYHILRFNWVSHWFSEYFFTKVTDSLSVILLIFLIVLILFKNKKKKISKVNTKYLLFYLSIVILFFEWFYNHPSLRYGGYTLITLIFFIPLSLYLEKFELNSIIVKKKVYFLLILSTLIFVSKNLNRINNEYNKYNYNVLKNSFYYLNKDGFIINDTVNKYYIKQKILNKNKYLILNEKTLN